MRKNRIHDYETVENFKRRRALPPIPGFSGEMRFFERILSARKSEELVFISKIVAKNR